MLHSALFPVPEAAAEVFVTFNTWRVTCSVRHCWWDRAEQLCSVLMLLSHQPVRWSC